MFNQRIRGTLSLSLKIGSLSLPLSHKKVSWAAAEEPVFRSPLRLALGRGARAEGWGRVSIMCLLMAASAGVMMLSPVNVVDERDQRRHCGDACAASGTVRCAAVAGGVRFVALRAWPALTMVIFSFGSLHDLTGS